MQVDDIKTYVCGFCGETRDIGAYCEPCKEAFPKRPPVDLGNHEARASELAEIMYAPLSVEFSDIHKRAEQLLGRSVWTHEFADPETLIQEALSGSSISFTEIVQKLSDRIPTTVVVVDP